MCPARDMPSLAHCLLEEADTRMFANVTEAAQRANKKISSRTIDSDVVILVIQQLGVDEL